MNRYVVTATPGLRSFGILDRELYQFCALVNEDRETLPLEWMTRAAAEAWLNTCYRVWQSWESGPGPEGAIIPKNWRPHPPSTSPFDRGVRFYS